MKKSSILKVSTLFCVFGISLSSCTVRHIHPYTEKKRKIKETEIVEVDTKPKTEGSLFNPNSDMSDIFTDLRAHRVGDLVTVIIEEEATAQRSANTNLSKESKNAADASAILGFMKALEEKNPNLDRTALLDISSKIDFKGGGSTNRTDKLEATVPAQVKRIFPGGNLFIEGSRAILVNDEEHHFYISGYVRSYDISSSNLISSKLISQAEIEFTGRGVLSEKNSQGFFTRILDYIWPF